LTEELTAKQLQTEIQRTMETNILSLEAGSMAQQVQAEFLQEMVKRVESYIK
jgi:fructose-1-phosphate kinase PfkB-like protein